VSYRKKLAVEAFKLGVDQIPDWFLKAIVANKVTLHTADGFWKMQPDFANIATIGGSSRAESGDWIIQGVMDEIYPCRADVFEATYEAVK
jgi:hypothetical protein